MDPRSNPPPPKRRRTSRRLRSLPPSPPWIGRGPSPPSVSATTTPWMEVSDGECSSGMEDSIQQTSLFITLYQLSGEREICRLPYAEHQGPKETMRICTTCAKIVCSAHQQRGGKRLECMFCRAHNEAWEDPTPWDAMVNERMRECSEAVGKATARRNLARELRMAVVDEEMTPLERAADLLVAAGAFDEDDHFPLPLSMPSSPTPEVAAAFLDMNASVRNQALEPGEITPEYPLLSIHSPDVELFTSSQMFDAASDGELDAYYHAQVPFPDHEISWPSTLHAPIDVDAEEEEETQASINLLSLDDFEL